MGYDPRLPIMAQTKVTLHLDAMRLPLLDRHAMQCRCRASGSRIAVALMLALALAAAGCAYRLDIRQGNVLEAESVNQVEVGMTRSQVQFLLGTPLVADPFHANRWDYTYYFRRGRERTVERRWISVYFENDRVARIEQHIAPDAEPEPETETASRRR